MESIQGQRVNIKYQYHVLYLKASIFSHPDFTVGYGITPYRRCQRVLTIRSQTFRCIRK
jgi:hypothetical protein